MDVSSLRILLYALNVLFCGVVLGSDVLEIFVDSGYDTDVYKTGPNTYTVFPEFQDDLVITCSSFLDDLYDTTIKLLFGDVILEEMTREEIEYNFPTRQAINPGNYSCIFSGSYNTPGGSTLSLDATSFVEILVIKTMVAPFCSSSVGDVGIHNEYADFYCFGPRVRWKGSGDRQVVESFFDPDELNKLSCVGPGVGNQEPLCRASDLPIVEEPEVAISPQYFPPSSDVLEFTCRTSPPRPVYWEIINLNDETVLETYHLDIYLTVDIGVTVVDELGESFLRIWKATPGGNGIRSVVYRTMVHHDDSAKFFNATAFVEHDNDQAKRTVTGLVVGIAIGLLVLVGLILGIVLFMCYRRSNKRSEASSTSGNPPDQNNVGNRTYGVDTGGVGTGNREQTSSGTTMHYNTAYAGYTEESASDENDPEYTYIAN